MVFRSHYYRFSFQISYKLRDYEFREFMDMHFILFPIPTSLTSPLSYLKEKRYINIYYYLFSSSISGFSWWFHIIYFFSFVYHCLSSFSPLFPLVSPDDSTSSVSALFSYIIVYHFSKRVWRLLWSLHIFLPSPLLSVTLGVGCRSSNYIYTIYLHHRVKISDFSKSQKRLSISSWQIRVLTNENWVYFMTHPPLSVPSRHFFLIFYLVSSTSGMILECFFSTRACFHLYCIHYNGFQYW